MTVKEAIKASGTYNPMAPGSTKEAERQLHVDETVLFAINANVSVVPVTMQLKIDTFNVKDKINGVFVITDKRLFFCSSILGRKQTKEFDLSEIKSIDEKINVLGFSKLRISGLTEMFVIDVDKKVLQTLKDTLNNARSSSSKNNTTESSNSAGYIDELERLAELLENGILTQEEFETKKKQLLGI